MNSVGPISRAASAPGVQAKGFHETPVEILTAIFLKVVVAGGRSSDVRLVCRHWKAVFDNHIPKPVLLRLRLISGTRVHINRADFALKNVGMTFQTARGLLGVIPPTYTISRVMSISDREARNIARDLILFCNALPDAIKATLPALTHRQRDFTDTQRAVYLRQNLENSDPVRDCTELSISLKRLAAIPSEIRFFESLRKLDLSYNRLTTLPPDIGLLRHLRELKVNDNEMTDLPEELYSLTELTWLCVSDNRLTRLSPGLERLVNLTELIADKNRITEVPSAIANMPSLHTLALSSNELQEMPSVIRRMPNLQKFYYDPNPFTESEEYRSSGDWYYLYSRFSKPESQVASMV